MADKTAGKQRGRPFLRGESGNPAGRPMGARHKATVAAEALLDGEAEALTRKAVEMALAGDGTARRLCLDRTEPFTSNAEEYLDSVSLAWVRSVFSATPVSLNPSKES